MKKILLFFMLLFVIGVAAYLGARLLGIEMRTSKAAFVLPVQEHLISPNANGELEFLLDITPTPWPEEAIWIFRLAQIGIPVKVILIDVSQPVSFVIKCVNSQGNLVVISKSKSDAVFLLKELGR